MLTECEGTTFIERMMLDILHCFVKKQLQNNSPCTLNLTCTHSFRRDINPRDPYNNEGGQGPDHKSWRGFSLSSTLIQLTVLPFHYVFYGFSLPLVQVIARK